MGHTPGPWTYTNGDNPIDIRTYTNKFCFANPCLEGADGNVVAGCDEYWVIGDQDEVGRANCLLISAAPDLLAACEAAIGEIEDNMTYEPDTPGWAAKLHAVLKTAIAKAKGTN